ncbi:MAG: hypothetical protein WCH74_09445, partial [Chloroflexota bacterium]
GRLAGPEGSHPLHGVSPEELVRQGDGPIVAEIVLDGPARVGEMVAGVVRLRAVDRIDSHGGVLRLVGLRLDEVRRSESHEDADGHTTSTDSWVEVDGTLFAKNAFPEPAIPANLEPGQTFEARFAIPAPRLGPPTAHLGEAIVAWALEVRWDIPMGDDHFVAAYLPIDQHPDLIRAGVGKQGGTSLLDAVAVGDAVIGVTTPLPAPAGSEIGVSIHWPSASGGSVGRVEIQRRTNAPNGETGVIASVGVEPKSLQGGTEVRLSIPGGTAPSFDGAGLENDYVIRVLVDRRFRPDAAIERPVAIV